MQQLRMRNVNGVSSNATIQLLLIQLLFVLFTNATQETGNVGGGLVAIPYKPSEIQVVEETSNSLRLEWYPPLRFGARVSEIELQVSEVDKNGFRHDWLKVPDNQVGHIANVPHLVQVIRTRADLGTMINAGTFRLTLPTSGQHDIRTESITVTPDIQFDAPPHEVAKAIEALSAVSDVSVERGQPDWQGGYSWTVTFTKHTNGIPLQQLQVYDNSLNAPWSSSGPQIMISHQSNDVLQVPSTLFCKFSCQYTIRNLQPGSSYSFRVREQYFNVNTEVSDNTIQLGTDSLTWGEFSDPSNEFRVVNDNNRLSANIEPVTTVPVLSSHNTTSISVQFHTLGKFWSPTWAYQAQFRIQSNMESQTDENWNVAVVSNPGVSNALPGIPIIATASGLSPGTSYEFRVRGLEMENKIVGKWVYSISKLQTEESMIAPKLMPIRRSTDKDPLTTHKHAIGVEWGITSQLDSIHATKRSHWYFEIEARDAEAYVPVWERVTLLNSGEVHNWIPLADPTLEVDSSKVSSQFSKYQGSTVTLYTRAISSNLNSNIVPMHDGSYLGKAQVIGLQLQGVYQYRIRLANKYEPDLNSPWSDPSEPIPFETLAFKESLTNTGHNGHEISETGPTQPDTGVWKPKLPALDDHQIQQGDTDSDYVFPSAVGGSGQHGSLIRSRVDGGHGLVVIAFHLHGLTSSPLISVFYHTNKVQEYIVPRLPASEMDHSSRLLLHVKVWGAGGGGGPTERTRGGSGGFVQGTIAVHQGERLAIMVGEGGKGSASGGSGGVGGGDGSVGVEDLDGLEEIDRVMFGTRFGAGGGGASWVARSVLSQGAQQPILLAAGGGGGAGVASSGKNSSCDKTHWDVVDSQNIPDSLPIGASGDDLEGQGGGGGGFPVSGSAGGSGVEFKVTFGSEEWSARDGGGGNAGACFIHPDAVHRVSTQTGTVQELNLRVNDVQAKLVILSWAAKRDMKSHLSSEPGADLILEKAKGPSSQDFEKVMILDPSASWTTVNNLSPSTSYQFRLRLFSKRTPNGEIQGIPVLVTTLPAPTNSWLLITTWMRQHSLGEIGGSQHPRTHASLLCESVRSQLTRPLPRASHSASIIGTEMLLFGGVVRAEMRLPEFAKTQTEAVQQIAESGCVTVDGHSNEIWSLNLLTNEWSYVSPHSLVSPSPRAGHSAVVLDDKLVVFGGEQFNVSSASDGKGVYPDTLLSDTWVLDTDLHKHMVVKFPTVTVSNLNRAQVELNFDGVENMCVENAKVRVNTDVQCTSELLIEVSAPDNRVGANLAAASKVPVLLFHGRQQVALGSNGTAACHKLFSKAEFDDAAAEFIDVTATHQFSTANNELPRFKPTERLARWQGLPASGIWALNVEDIVGNFDDTRLDGAQYTTGQVDVELDLVLKPCNRSPKWVKVDTSASSEEPSARHSHSTVVVDGKLYVYGGINEHGSLDDLWVLELGAGIGNWFNENSIVGTWKQLTPIQPMIRFPSSGPVQITRYGLLALGMTDPASYFVGQDQTNVAIYDFLSREWSSVESTSSNFGPHPRRGQSFVWSSHKVQEQLGQKGEALILHGGFDGTKYWDDIWELDVLDNGKLRSAFQTLVADPGAPIDSVSESEMATGLCTVRLGQKQSTKWLDGCGFPATGPGNPPGGCQIEELFGMAWCSHWIGVS